MNQARLHATVSTTPSHPAGWLLVTSDGAWRRLRADGAWRFAARTMSRASQIRRGDIGIVYLAQGQGTDNSIASILRFRDNPSEGSREKLFGALYPYQAPFEVICEPREPAQFRPLLGRLSFIGDAANYGRDLQGHAVRLLSHSDLDVLADALRRAE